MSQNYVVRYGNMRLLGEFSARADDEFLRGREVIIRTDRGVEWGEVLSVATERSSELLGEKATRGRILRAANNEDRVALENLKDQERDNFTGGLELIAEHKLQMQLVDVELIFGGERLVFYYLAEKRVDFRELVKSLARKFRTRIEMRQIGVRDEARLMADYGDCGKPVCCNTHLSEMPPVSMRMAKLQKATLDPTKISGRCGRLKCCLRYEFDTYEQYRRELPRVGATVITRQGGQGKVIGQEILAQKVMVVYEGGRRMLTDADEIVTVIGRGKNKNEDQTDQSAPPRKPAENSGDSSSAE